MLRQAYKHGFLPPKYMFITSGWYEEGWWKEGYSSEDYNCTADNIAAVALYNLASVLQEFPDEDSHFVAEPNIVSMHAL